MAAINTLEPASEGEVDKLTLLINQAYRGQNGWTKETGIVKGERTSSKDLRGLIDNPVTHMLVAKADGSIAACICIEEKGNQAYIGTFAVNPSFQNQGIGSQVLKLAEDYAVQKLGSKKLIIVVISQRVELISFYERRGYSRTGEIYEYPLHLNVGIPTVDGLTIEYLEKIT